MSFSSYSLLTAALHKGGQVERVASILDAENAEKEAVHNQDNAAPSPHGDNLDSGIGNPGNLDGQGDGSKGENTVYGLSKSAITKGRQEKANYNLHKAATTWVSKPYWFWKPAAK